MREYSETSNTLHSKAKKLLLAEKTEHADNLFRQAALIGNYRSFKYIARCLFRKDLTTPGNREKTERLIKAGMMKRKDPLACLEIAGIERIFKYPDPGKVDYYLRLSREYDVFKIENYDAKILSDIEEEEKFLYDNKHSQTTETLNESDYFWSIATPFWNKQYRENPRTKAILDACESKETIERFQNDSKHSEKITERHSALIKYLGGFSKRQKIYLVYAEGEFNKPEVAQLIESTMQKYSGCDVEIHEWKSVTHIPKDAIVALLSDSTFLAESQKPIDQQADSYKIIHNYKGKKVVLPWQIPPEIMTPTARQTLSEEWKSWDYINSSLLDEPLKTLKSISEIAYKAQLHTLFHDKKIYFDACMREVISATKVTVIAGVLALIALAVFSVLMGGIPLAAFITAGSITALFLAGTLVLRNLKKQVNQLQVYELVNRKNTSLCCLLWRKLAIQKIERQKNNDQSERIISRS